MYSFICKWCNKELKVEKKQQYAVHIRNCKDNPNKFLSDSLAANKMRETYAIKKNHYIKQYLDNPKYCEKCDILLTYEQRKNKYCSHSCSASVTKNGQTPKVWSLKSKITASIRSKKLWEDENYVNKQITNSKFFNSKGELEIVDYFKTKFPFEEWTSGGCLKYKGERIVRDLYSNKLKVCIEYDGIWHFKDIKGQLTKKQFKDKLFEEWCLENNYKLIRIKEEIYQRDKTNILNKIVELIYNSNITIEKIYT